MYYENRVQAVAEKLNDWFAQRYWIQREGGQGAQELLRQACVLAGREYRVLNLSQCMIGDVEHFLQNLPDVPGVIVLDEYDRTREEDVMKVNFILHYYKYRSSMTPEAGEVSIPLNWKFVICTRPRAWIADNEVHKLLCRL